jgi:hypothetical protein
MSDTFINDTAIGYLVTGQTPLGDHDIWLGEDQLDEYRADPDLFVARELGVTKEEYLEWMKLGGAALCGARTKAGQPCRAVIAYFDSSPTGWKKYHRNALCHVHERQYKERGYVCTHH